MTEKHALNLQRLVDGECSKDEVTGILREADQQPGAWKAIATAFVEDQFWRRQFQSLESRPDAQHRNLSSVAPVGSGGTNGSLLEAESAPPRGRPRFPLYWLTLAATCAVAATIGFTAGKGTRSGNPATYESLAQVNPSESIATEDVSSPTPRMTPASLKADHHLQLIDGQGFEQGMIPDGEIPLYAIESPEEIAHIPTAGNRVMPVAPEVLARLRQQGFRLRQDVNFISGNLRDGRRFVVPVRTLMFVPGQ
jgi:hypothetical protein